MMNTVSAYENIAFAGSSITLTVIIWGVYAGLVCGCIAAAYSKDFLGRAVRTLLRRQCNTPESALTVEKLGVKASFGFRHAMREGGVLSKYIAVANPDECRYEKERSGLSRTMLKFFTGSAENKTVTDYKKAKLYIPEDKKFAADVRYEKKGPSLPVIALCIVLGAAVAVGLSFAVPKILELLDQAITAFKSLGEK